MSQSFPEDLFLKDLIRRIHTELKQSHEQRLQAGEPALFEVERLTVEVHFVATRSGTGHGGLDFQVITAGGSKTYEQQQVHKITLSLKSLSEESGDVLTDLDASATGLRPRGS